jgi:hypothetical protein
MDDPMTKRWGTIVHCPGTANNGLEGKTHKILIASAEGLAKEVYGKKTDNILG